MGIRPGFYSLCYEHVHGYKKYSDIESWERSLPSAIKLKSRFLCFEIVSYKNVKDYGRKGRKRGGILPEE